MTSLYQWLLHYFIAVNVAKSRQNWQEEVTHLLQQSLIFNFVCTLKVIFNIFRNCSCIRKKNCAYFASYRNFSVLLGEWMFICCECCVLSGEISESAWSLVQRGHTKFDVSEYDREASIVRRPWPTRDCCAMVGDIFHEILSSGYPLCCVSWKYRFRN